MYQAPDRYKRMIAARTPDGADVGVASTKEDKGSSPLRDVQLISRAQLAPFFAIANIIGALLVPVVLHSALDPVLLLGWIGSVAAINIGAMMLAKKQAITNIGRSGRPVPTWLLMGEVLARAAVWLSLPVYVFESLSGGEQVILAATVAGLGIGGLGLVVVPRAATVWLTAFTASISYCLLVVNNQVPFEFLVVIAFLLAVSIFGVTTLSKWAFSQLKKNADVGSASESASLLLQEYEKRGVGWLWQTDDEHRVTYLSSRMAALLGRPTSGILGHTLPHLFAGSKGLNSTLSEAKQFTNLELEIDCGDRGKRWVSMAGDPIIDPAGRFAGFRGVGSDITDVRNTQERLTHLANMDVLSGLPNRGRVRQLLGEALREATTSNVPCAIMFLDLDGFKPVNDTFGHPKGDAVLQAVAKRLVQEVGEGGHVGRMGGDEFAIIVNDGQSRRNVEALADRIIKSIAEPYMIDQIEIRIGVSIGCAFGPIDGATVDDLILKADLALYEAKGAGRGVARYFSHELQSEQEDKVRLENDLRAAIASKQFHLMYQPLVQAKDQRLVGFEALIRWEHPERGYVPPPVFIGMAEEMGLMMELGQWVIEEACRTLAQWPEPITVAVNVSPKQIVMPALPNLVSQALSRHGVPGNRLELEVTEGIFLGDNSATLDTMKRLRQLGVGIALDDFGTGYSSIGYLNKAVFHKLKIDGSFVREAGTREENVAIIKSIVQLAKSFRMNVTAEGVETAEDFERMRDLGVDTIQGYLFGRPLSYERATNMVASFAARKRA